MNSFQEIQNLIQDIMAIMKEKYNLPVWVNKETRDLVKKDQEKMFEERKQMLIERLKEFKYSDI